MINNTVTLLDTDTGEIIIRQISEVDTENLEPNIQIIYNR